MSNLAIENRLIRSDTPGIALHLRRKRRTDITIFGAERTLLLMHGATLPADSLFDVPVGEGAFMDVLADAGFDVWALNVRGFGASTRPAGMNGSPDAAPPQVSTADAICDLAAAVDHIRAAQDLRQLTLIGMSWGGTVTAAYSAAHPANVAKLVLIAPQWLSDGPPRIDPGGPVPAYRRFNVHAFRDRWLESVPQERRKEILPDAWFAAWADIILASDPVARDSMIRAPAGVIQDVRDYWSAGKPFYEPEAITAPVLLLHGEWDLDVPSPRMLALFQRLTGARYKRWIEIGEATHMMVMERNRWQVLSEILHFLRSQP